MANTNTNTIAIDSEIETCASCGETLPSEEMRTCLECGEPFCAGCMAPDSELCHICAGDLEEFDNEC